MCKLYSETLYRPSLSEGTLQICSAITCSGLTAISFLEPFNSSLFALWKVKWFHYRPIVAQRVGRVIAVLFHDHGTRRGWVVSSMPRLHFTPGKDPVPIVQEAGWAPGPVWTGGKSRPHRDSILDHPARSQSLYQLSYLAHSVHCTTFNF